MTDCSVWTCPFWSGREKPGIRAPGSGPVLGVCAASTAAHERNTIDRICSTVSRGGSGLFLQSRLPHPLDEGLHVLSVLFFLGEDLFHHPPAGGVVLPEE